MAERSRTILRATGVRLLAVGAALAVLALAPRAEATFRYGPVQISGNLESQQLIRLDKNVEDQLQAFDLVQQRNTFRLQYEHELVKQGKLLDMLTLPGIKKAGFFAYYRFVYDSIYDIAPGVEQRGSDGSGGGSIEDLSSSARSALRIENVLREVFVDLELDFLPVSFRIGRQQVVWGNSVNFRALDNTNALDLSWHMQQEAGILGRVGFSELRIPAWMIKALVKLPSVGPFSNNYFEAYDIPFEFTPTRATFLPRPWGLPFRNPFRAGHVVDAGGGQLFQVCFDPTKNLAPNTTQIRALQGDGGVDWDLGAATGICPTLGRQRSKASQGLYEDHDPKDVNQFGVRLGSTFNPLGLGFTLNYKYQRHIADATGGSAARSWANLVNDDPTPYVIIDPHSTTDPATGVTSQTQGFARVPLEFYYPYISIFGASLDYFDEFTSAVYNFEISASKGVPIANLNPDVLSPGVRKTWEYEMALLIDRPTWIRFLNPRSTFTTLIQGNLSMVPDRDKVVCSGPGVCESGDVGLPNSNAIPGLFRDDDELDQRRKFEYLTIVAMQTFYWGGSLSPLVAWISDWTNMPGFEWLITVQYLPTPNLILEPTFRIFYTNGRAVDDRYSVSKLAGRSELQMKITYQF